VAQTQRRASRKLNDQRLVAKASRTSITAYAMNICSERTGFIFVAKYEWVLRRMKSFCGASLPLFRHIGYEILRHRSQESVDRTSWETLDLVRPGP
jgi:hypothetical protein